MTQGTLHHDDDGAWRLEFRRQLDHDVDRVWQAIADPQQRAVWFPQTVTGELTTGATLMFTDDRLPAFTGSVLAAEPPRLLEFTWGGDVIRIELEPRDGGCVLTLFDTIDARGKAARDAAGWHECLDYLVAAVDGVDPSWQPGDRWKAEHPGYVERFGPEAATIGVPEEYRELMP